MIGSDRSRPPRTTTPHPQTRRDLKDAQRLHERTSPHLVDRHEPPIRAAELFTKHIELFIRERPLELGKNHVLLDVRMSREPLPQRPNPRPLSLPRRRSDQDRPRCPEDPRMFTLELLHPLVIPNLPRARDVDIRFFDANVSLDSRDGRAPRRLARERARIAHKMIKKRSDVAMLLLQQIQCIHGPSPWAAPPGLKTHAKTRGRKA